MSRHEPKPLARHVRLQSRSRKHDLPSSLLDMAISGLVHAPAQRVLQCLQPKARRRSGPDRAQPAAEKLEVHLRDSGRHASSRLDTNRSFCFSAAPFSSVADSTDLAFGLFGLHPKTGSDAAAPSSTFTMLRRYVRSSFMLLQVKCAANDVTKQWLCLSQSPLSM